MPIIEDIAFAFYYLAKAILVLTRTVLSLSKCASLLVVPL